MVEAKWDPEKDTLMGPSPLASSLASGRGETTAPALELPDSREALAEFVAGEEIGRRVGRYVILSVLGSGAMGVVFAAYDTQLDRKVALKRLRTAGVKRRAVAERQSRLRREAQALARLNHVNVVTIHEVAVYSEQLYIVMEFVEGQTLREWLEQPRGWREVLEVFGAAGLGLGAAHAAGLTHRDFKPDNVMLGDDGRVRVMDFGLVRLDESFVSSDDAGSGLDDAPAPRYPTSELDLHLTRTGAWLGTPAYMAPEQFAGRATGAFSDQFSFCVALYEACFGRRPFKGKTVSQLGAAVLRGRVEPTPRGSKIPTWLTRVVLRGLECDPVLRHPSMETLLDALTQDPRVRARRLGVVAAVSAAFAGAIWFGSALSAPPAPAGVCKGFAVHLSGTWDVSRRAAVEAALRDTKLSYAEDTWSRVEAGLDGYAARWVRAREDACRATSNGEQSGALLDLRMACLDRHLVQLGATVELLATADEGVVREAVALVRGLPQLSSCADAEALMAAPTPDDPTLAARVRELDGELVELLVVANAGKVSVALTRASEVVREAKELGYEPLEARVLLVEAGLLGKTQRYEEAEAKLRRVYESAVGLNMKLEAAEASIRLMELLGRQLARYEEAERWQEDARPWTRAVGDEQTRAEYLNIAGMIARDRGRYEEAKTMLEQALVAGGRAYGAEHFEVASPHIALGITHAKLGDNGRAQAQFERALQIYESEVGPSHPQVGSVLNNLALLAGRAGDDARARIYLERALELFSADDAYHPALSTILTNLGAIENRAGQHQQAREHLERALELKREALGPEHPKLSSSLAGLAHAERELGELAAARTHLERALDLTRAAHGIEHPEAAKVLLELGLLARKEGNDALALEQVTQALGIYERSVGPTHPEIGQCLVERAVLREQAGQLALAREDYARALEVNMANYGPDAGPTVELAAKLAKLDAELASEG